MFMYIYLKKDLFKFYLNLDVLTIIGQNIRENFNAAMSNLFKCKYKYLIEFDFV